METIEIHGNSIYIGMYTFLGCDNLKSITIESRGEFTAKDIGALGLSKQVVVKCYANTAVFVWAVKNGLTVEWLD